MGIGRRAFLKLFGAGLTSLAARPSSAVALFGDDYVNRRLGVAFRKPPGWVFSDVGQMGEIAKGQTLQLDKPELLEEVWPNRDLPILVLARESISSDADRFVPGITIFLNRHAQLEKWERELGLEFQTPMEVAADDIKANRQVLKRFRVQQEPQPREVSRCNAAEHCAEFQFEHVNLKTPTRVRMRTLCIWQDPNLYTIRMFDAPDDMVDYESFIETVRIV